MENTTTITATAKVQHVTKASSDQLLRKFSEVECESDRKLPTKKELRVIKRRKRSEITKGGGDECTKSVNGRKALLPPPANSRSSVALARRFRGRDFRNKSIMGAIQKTWRKTIEGASKVFMENHYNRHKRLINDIY